MADSSIEARLMERLTEALAASIEAKMDERARRLFDTARAAGMPITGDWRVNERNAAMLLGYSTGAMRNMRSQRRGPPWLKIQGRISYCLVEIARWIQEREKLPGCHRM